MNESYVEIPNKDNIKITYDKINMYLKNGFSIPDILKEVQRYGELCKVSQLQHNDEALKSEIVTLESKVERLNDELQKKGLKIKCLEEKKGYNDLKLKLDYCVKERDCYYESISDIADILDGLGVVIKED